jgi:DNA-binding beta-propeller fold protein YncE
VGREGGEVTERPEAANTPLEDLTVSAPPSFRGRQGWLTSSLGSLAVTIGTLFSVAGRDQSVLAQDSRQAQDVQTVALQANSLACDPERKLLYAAANKLSPVKNTIRAIDPATGKVKWSVNVGSDPGVLALSEKTRKLWIGLNGESGIQAVDLDKRDVGPVLPLGRGPNGPLFVESMVVLPGTTDTVVVALRNNYFSPRHEGVVVYDKGVARRTRTPSHTGSNRIVLGDRPGVLYGYNNESTESGLRELVVDKDGVEQIKLSKKIPDFTKDIVFGNGRIYASTGAVVDAQTGELVGTIRAKGLVAIDAAKKQVYYLIEDRTLKAFDSTTLTEKGSCTVGKIDTGYGTRSLVLMGDTGFAFLTHNQVVLVPRSLLREKRE